MTEANVVGMEVRRRSEYKYIMVLVRTRIACICVGRIACIRFSFKLLMLIVKRKTIVVKPMKKHESKAVGFLQMY